MIASDNPDGQNYSTIHTISFSCNIYFFDCILAVWEENPYHPNPSKLWLKKTPKKSSKVHYLWLIDWLNVQLSGKTD